MSRAQVCPGCTNRFTKGRAAHVVLGGEVKAATVCQECAGAGLLLVIPSAAAASRARNAPIAAYIRKLAKAYDLNDDHRAEGMRQAADILESGRAVPIEDEAPPLSEMDRAPRPGARSPREIATSLLNGSASVGHRDDKPARFSPGEHNGAKSSSSEHNGAAPPAGKAPIDRAILSTLAVAKRPLQRASVAIWSGYSSQSGSFAAALTRLRAAALIEGPPGAIALTDAGRAAAEGLPVDVLGGSIVGYWCELVGPCAAAILETLASAYPEKVEREALAERTGYSANSGSFAAALTNLRRLELVDGFRASSALMEGS